MRILHYTFRMENPEHHEDESLEDWINRAKRAHELLDAVDLDKVIAHDPEEIDKVASVKDAISDLEKGRDVSHVEGVDDVVPELEPTHCQRAALIEMLSSLGLAERISRVLKVQGEEQTLLPVDVIPHHEGLPEFTVALAPKEAISEGNFAVLISEQALFAAVIKSPPAKHHWRILRSRPYEGENELKKSVQQFVNQPLD